MIFAIKRPHTHTHAKSCPEVAQFIFRSGRPHQTPVKKMPILHSFLNSKHRFPGVDFLVLSKLLYVVAWLCYLFLADIFENGDIQEFLKSCFQKFFYGVHSGIELGLPISEMTIRK